MFSFFIDRRGRGFNEQIRILAKLFIIMGITWMSEVRKDLLKNEFLS